MTMGASMVPAAARRRDLRRGGVILCVVLMHGLGLWALQSGLIGRAVETLTTLPVFVHFVEVPVPPVAPPAVRPVAPVARLRPVPVAPVQPAPAPLPSSTEEAPPTPVATPEPVPAPPSAEPVMTAAVPSAEPPPPPPIVLPSSSAAYLDNPAPPYPAASRQLGEAGRVVVRVFIGLEGTALQAQLAVSSGYDRLDAVALQTARRWRYVPGREAGIPKPMWFDVPIHFVLGR